MDNDDMRRGKPSCHIVYGEAYALLAGDALLNFAFETMLSAKNNIPADNKIKACLNIANCSGVNGMIGGQAIDLSNEGNSITEEILLRLYRDKTAMLLKAACVSGAILGGGDESKIKSAEEYAMNLGIAFQIVDDILDCTGDSAVLGKPIGSDEKNDKNTYVHFHGIEGAKAEAERLTEKAVIALDSFEDNEFLKELSYMLCHRNY
jgi:geranylgeranyl diphosphate synthase type II